MRGRFAVTIAAFAALAAAPASAASLTAALNVHLRVTAACSSFSARLVDFGSAPAGTSGILASGVLSVRCVHGIPYKIALDVGMNPAAGARQLTDGVGDFRTYVLYRDVHRTAIWGDDGVTYGYPSLTGTGTGNAQSINVYGTVSTLKTTAPGDYMDTVTATLIF